MNRLLKKYEKVVEKRAQKIMLKLSNGSSLTYKDFDQKVDLLAAFIEKEFEGLDIVPILSNDNLDYLTAMLAAWKVGKIYMPINSNTPPKKVENMLEAIKSKLILTRNYEGTLDNIKELSFESSQSGKYALGINQVASQSGSDTAYILSTSGTTGNPKMVQVTFDNLYWLLDQMNELVPFTEGDTFIISTPPQFDVSFHESLSFIFGTGSLQFMEPGTPIQQFKNLKKILLDGSISHIALSPTSLKTLLAMTRSDFRDTGLKNIILAGEALPVNLANQLLTLMPELNLFNCYGPTETTIYASYYQIKNQVETSSVPIGQPLKGADIKFYQDQLTNPNQGEILIGGCGVSRGYFGNPKFTAERFINLDGKTYYRTGDLGYKEDGLIYYQGREDKQVKINGIRIELAEIEQAIHSYIDDFTSFNVLKIDNNLVLFSDRWLDFSYLKNCLENHLPSYMIPSYHILVKEFKLTASNKLDLAFLEEEFKQNYQVDWQGSDKLEEKRPRTESLNSLIAGILNLPSLDDDKNLRLLSQMDSLTEIEVIMALEDYYGLNLSEDFLKQNQTIKDIKSSLTGNYRTESYDKDQLTDFQKANYYANLKNIRELNKIILKRGARELKDSYYLQKAYLADDFRQVLELKLVLPKEVREIEQIEGLVDKVIEKSELLRSFIRQDEGQKLAVYEPYRHKIPVISRNTLENLRDLIIKDLEDVVFDRLLWEVYFVEDTSELHFFINHLITDKSSLSILERDILTSLEGGTLESNPTYSDFIRFIDENSRPESLEAVCSQGFELVAGADFYSKSYGETKNYLRVKTPYKNHYDNIFYGNFILARLLCQSQDQNIVAGSTIINLRQFDGYDFSQVFGDVHTTLPFVYRKEDSEESFRKSYDLIYSYFLRGDNLNNSIYKAYPYIPEDLKKYEFYLDDNLKFSSNFLGAIREKDLEETIEELCKQQYSLENFSRAKLYITYFSCGEDLIFLPITQGLINI
ncbi:AMP-binding protein [Streptococcaceae bacterium ESL0687]|nr:AMP-binding protein [Streptococcaceae bacterium ESL0687]